MLAAKVLVIYYFKKREKMPEIVRFYGIIIKMFFGDHAPPHIHAIYGEYISLFDLQKCCVIRGDLPNRAEKIVLEWLNQHHHELLEMWNTQKIHKLPPLK